MYGGRAGEQFSVHVRLGPDPLMTVVFSTVDSQHMMETLDGSTDDVDSLFTSLLIMSICHIHWIPLERAMLQIAGVIDDEIARMRAEMESPDEGDFPF